MHFGFNLILTSVFHLFFVSVLHEVEEDTVEFSWKRNRLFNHTACLVLYQICMEVQYVEFGGAWFIVATLLCIYIYYYFYFYLFIFKKLICALKLKIIHLSFYLSPLYC